MLIESLAEPPAPPDSLPVAVAAGVLAEVVVDVEPALQAVETRIRLIIAAASAVRLPLIASPLIASVARACEGAVRRGAAIVGRCR